jgi:hypothetical protein
MTDRARDSRAIHPFDSGLLLEHCIMCGELAAHVVAEVSAGQRRDQSRVTAALCCGHFMWIMGRSIEHAGDVPLQREGSTP